MKNAIRDPLQLSRRKVLFSMAGASGVAACASQLGPLEVRSMDSEVAGGDTERAVSVFTLNIETWWRGQPLLERIDAAAKSGFSSVEMWWLGNESDRSPKTLKQRAQDAGVEVIHCTVNVPNLAGASEKDAREAVESSLEQIQTLGARYATIVGHSDVEGMTKPEMLAAYKANLRAIAPLFEVAQIIGCIEPFNPFDHPEHFLYGADDAVSICRSIDSANVKVNWDLFHMQRHEGNVVHRLREGLDQCALLQIADSPHRREPGTGEMDYSYILNEAFELGFSGPIGLECFPEIGAEDLALDRLHSIALKLPKNSKRKI